VHSEGFQSAFDPVFQFPSRRLGLRTCHSCDMRHVTFQYFPFFHRRDFCNFRVWGKSASQGRSRQACPCVDDRVGVWHSWLARRQLRRHAGPPPATHHSPLTTTCAAKLVHSWLYRCTVSPRSTSIHVEGVSQTKVSRTQKLAQTTRCQVSYELGGTQVGTFSLRFVVSPLALLLDYLADPDLHTNGSSPLSSLRSRADFRQVAST
jgi:hypothetical protein